MLLKAQFWYLLQSALITVLHEDVHFFLLWEPNRIWLGFVCVFVWVFCLLCFCFVFLKLFFFKKKNNTELGSSFPSIFRCLWKVMEVPCNVLMEVFPLDPWDLINHLFRALFSWVGGLKLFNQGAGAWMKRQEAICGCLVPPPNPRRFCKYRGPDWGPWGAVSGPWAVVWGPLLLGILQPNIFYCTAKENRKTSATCPSASFLCSWYYLVI